MLLDTRCASANHTHTEPFSWQARVPEVSIIPAPQCTRNDSYTTNAERLCRIRSVELKSDSASGKSTRSTLTLHEEQHARHQSYGHDLYSTSLMISFCGRNGSKIGYTESRDHYDAQLA